MKPLKEERMKEEEIEESRTSEKVAPSGGIVIKINTKTALALVIVLVIAGALFFFKDLFVVAIVDGKPVTRIDVVRELEKRSGKQALDAMIIKRLVNAEMNKKNITASDEEVSAEIKNIEAQMAARGGTLQQILDQQGMSQEDLREQVGDQKRVEKFFADKLAVSDEEVAKYMKDNSITVPEGKDPKELSGQIKDQLKQQKLSTEVDAWIAGLKSAANIRYLKTY
ncbi:SurA N-terminal domain-containing protein [Candidatus Uhrbacteria bacterium]|nr:SurA N-terminal domain-containing protein [Candidatus Uhrbacteria bacterium]